MHPQVEDSHLKEPTVGAYTSRCERGLVDRRGVERAKVVQSRGSGLGDTRREFSWREIGQRGWLGTPGSPGGLSLHEGNHTEFAEHVCKEKLLEKLQGKYGMAWTWRTQPGWHDWGDAETMCYVAAVWQGIGTQGRVVKQTRKRRRSRSVEI